MVQIFDVVAIILVRSQKTDEKKGFLVNAICEE